MLCLVQLYITGNFNLYKLVNTIILFLFDLHSSWQKKRHHPDVKRDTIYREGVWLFLCLINATRLKKHHLCKNALTCRICVCTSTERTVLGPYEVSGKKWKWKTWTVQFAGWTTKVQAFIFFSKKNKKVVGKIPERTALYFVFCIVSLRAFRFQIIVKVNKIWISPYNTERERER